ncbi:hypothetical protein [Gluconobacter cerinus]|nr:hypothetical protein [Gluconobacter cerinus]
MSHANLLQDPTRPVVDGHRACHNILITSMVETSVEKAGRAL